MSDKDYIAAHVVEEGDKVDYGVPGMKWGQRRSRSALAKAAAQRSATPDHLASKSGGPETSVERYARLTAEAKAGKGRQMSDDDLKFFNARTEALKKVEKLNETNPGWLKSTSKSVLQTTAQKQMQTLADTLATKYIGGPLSEKVTGAAAKALAEKTAKKAAEAAKEAKSDAQKAKDQAIAKTAAEAAALAAKTDAKARKPKTLFSGN